MAEPGIPPPPGVAMNLKAATPTPFDDAALELALATMGLDCSQITKANLNAWILEVTSQMESGTLQAFAITAPAGQITDDAGVAAAQAMTDAEVGSAQATVPASESAGTGNWTELNSAEGYHPNLEIMQFPAHFDWLYSQRESIGFPGQVIYPPPSIGNFPNAAAIQKLFIEVGTSASAKVVGGVDKSDMQASFAKAIQPVNDNNIKNYNVPGSRAIYLVDNYNETTKYADGVGVVTVSWRLQIEDWQRKTKHGGDTHHTVLTVNARSMLYSDVTLLCKHYSMVLKQFGIDPGKAPSCRT